jgi:hypothetical protein
MASLTKTNFPILQIEKTDSCYDGQYIIDKLGEKLGDNTLISHVEEIELSDKLGNFKQFIIHFHNTNKRLDDIFEIIFDQGLSPIIYNSIFSSKFGFCDMYWDLTLYKPLILTNTIE